MRPPIAELWRWAAFAFLATAASTAAAGRPPKGVGFINVQHQGGAIAALRGERDLRTPNLDRLAARGITFTRAYAANPRCAPSRSSLFTGYYPHQTGVQENDPPTPYPFTYPLLGRYFTDAGYRTAYFGKLHIPVPEGAQRGFERMAHLRSIGQDEDATRDAVAFLRASRDPFLLVVSYCNPHNICEFGRNEPLPDGPIGALPAVPACPPAVPNPDLPRSEADAMVEQRALRATEPDYRVLEKYTPDDWRRYRWAYFRMIEKVDAQIGRVLDALRAAGEENNTLIVFTSDHGETAGAHGFSEKVVFYEESVRVPLMLSWPREIPPARSANLVNTGIDLAPTLLDFGGIAGPSSLPGRSLRPLAAGRSSGSWRDYVVSENLMMAGKTPVNGRMVRTARYKYCVYDRGARRESLFDERDDPLEKVNLAGDPAHAAELHAARALLAEHARQTHDTVAEACLAAVGR
jgi:arylsulfatase A-like enzyme